MKEELKDIFYNYRSSGHLIAFDFENRNIRDEFVSKAYQKNLLVNPTGERSVRLRPNLALNKLELENAINILKEVSSFIN